MAKSPHQIDVEFLTKGLHDKGGPVMARELQTLIDAVDPQRYEAILLGYALCGNGLAGVTARTLPLIAPRAHDCIALFMGGRAQYQKYFDANPGVYYRSPGWLERGTDLDQSSLNATRKKTGSGYTLEELIEKYGEENAQYLFEEFGRYKSSYSKLTYIETGVEPDGSFEAKARAEAVERKWEFEKVPGTITWFERLVNGDWAEEDFVIVQPGSTIVPSYDERVMQVEAAQ